MLFQLIHQGTKLIPCDFCFGHKFTSQYRNNHHQLLLSNFCETQALMQGKTKLQVIAKMKNDGFSQEQIDKIATFRIFEGNIPTNSILLKN